jgi:hypothetical protein
LPLSTPWCVKIDTTIDLIDWMWFLTFFPSHHCVAISAAGHADAGNVTQDDQTQANNDYDNGLDNFPQTHTDSKVLVELIRALRRVD